MSVQLSEDPTSRDPILPLSAAERKAWVEAAQNAIAAGESVRYGFASRVILRYELMVKRLEQELRQLKGC